ncbi:hypothetical protein [Frankia nepalensis]|uniref:Uncharacterized protein n=1 Tax=Frankia nepalensis TaxID=1836974 RepID=A0A937UQU2_9ACTN|nr:hypothetical protein [Frankia nepalensis]MBL7502007.1 hypothetical protein [Frankia nepalensis]MBL7510317.1 hypothetical protein [Frankia nepalensis]MBL7630448.1 hypothetical protein [Frankia nepalensis]
MAALIGALAMAGQASAADTAPVTKAVPVPTATAKPSSYVAPSGIAVDHYTQGPGGTTVTTTESGGGVSTFGASLPFNYTVEFDSNLRGRDMNASPNGIFCNDFTATSSAGPQTYIVIQLHKGSTDYSAIAYPTTGGQHGYCWIGVGNSGTYHFTYHKPQPYGFTTVGYGTVHN